MQALANLFPAKPTPWFFTKRQEIYQLHISQIEQAINALQFVKANELLTNAERYSDDKKQLAQLKTNLLAKKAEKEAADAKVKEAQRLAALAKKKQQALANKAQQDKQAQLKVQRENTNLYNLAMANVNEQLACSQRLNMRDFKIAIEKLRTLDNRRYKKAEAEITRNLASCITTMGTVSPDYAKDAKRYALLLFNGNPAIASVVIKEKDGCQLAIAGQGAGGTRKTCKDSLKVGGTGPTMVVIPGANKIKPFAISKYEVSVGQYNVYCSKTQACPIINGVNQRLPVTNISLKDMISYTLWLSQTTGKQYRLPNKKEWLHAATAKDNKLDSNRNCQISSRGIQKGDELIKTTTGRQNTWGLVNYAGNAQELVFISSKRVAAVGGSYQTPMDVCTSDAMVKHSGDADGITGFRLARDLIGS